jgi:hypothetical protein
MSLLDVKGQAVKLYKEGETLFNNKTSKCEWHLDYENKIGCTDISEILLNTEVIASDIQNDGEFSTNVVGISSGDFAFRLNDVLASFTTTTEIGMFVRNLDNDTFAKIVSIISDTVIEIDTDIFNLGAPTNYSISYWEISGGMDISSGQLVNTSGGAVGTCKQYSLPLENQFYKISIDVIQFISLLDGSKIEFKIGGNTVLELDETIVNTGRFTFNGISSGVDFAEFEIICSENIDAIFDNISISQYSNAIFFIANSDDDSAAYYSELSDILMSNTQDQMKISVDWSKVDCNGCYYISILENVEFPENIGAEKIINGNFDTDTDWSKGTGWSISGGKAIMSIAGLGGDLVQLLANDNQLSYGLCYQFSIEVSDYFQGEFQVAIGQTGSSKELLSQPISANGVYTFEVSSSKNTISIRPTGTGFQSYKIDNVSCIIDLACSGYKFRTDDFTVSDSFDCSIKLSGYNNDSAFGIDFVGLNYNPIIRVNGELTFPFFDGEKVNEENSFGVSENLYFKSEMKRNLFLSNLPEYLHNFIRLLIGYDIFLIDDTEYISLDPSYEPISERVSGKIVDLADVTKEVRLKEDLNKNRFC